MKISFRQGIIAKPTLPKMLYESNGAVSIRLDRPLILAFAHGKKDYIYTIEDSVERAWVLPENESSVWLYWEINQITGELEYGYSTAGYPLNYGSDFPSNPIRGQHYFDHRDNRLKVWNGGKWLTKIRLFAGEWNGSTLNELGIYSQANLKGERRAGHILFDRHNRPVFSYDDDESRTKYFATDEGSALDNIFSNTHKIALDKIQLNSFAGEALGRNKCVVIGDDLKVYLGSREGDRAIIGITDKAYAVGEKVSLITHGFVENREDWNWSVEENAKLFVDDGGNLTPQLVNDISSQIIASVVSPKVILVNIQERIEVLTDVKPQLTVTPTVTPAPTATPTITPVTTVTPTVTVTPEVTPSATP